MMIEFGFLGMKPTEKWLEILGEVKVNKRGMERESVLYGDGHSGNGLVWILCKLEYIG